MNQLTNQLINFFLPPLCIHCQREGAWLCAKAQAQLEAEPVYSEPIPLPNIDGVFIRGSYDCIIFQKLIHKLKYSYWSAAQDILPTILSPLAPRLKQLPTDTAIVPVPLHTRRIRERGFNQSVLIANALHNITGWPVTPALKRHRYTVPQVQLSEKNRMKNVVDAFVMKQNFTSIPKSVVLVDDVLTTGTTLTECAKILRRCGTKTIGALALAKG